MQPVHSAGSQFLIIPLSDRSALVSFGNIIDPVINEKVLSLHKALLQSSFDGFVESVPAYSSLAVFYDVAQTRKHAYATAFDFVRNYLQHLLQQISPVNNAEASIIKIPVCYHPDFGIDIEQLALAHRLSLHEVVSLHSSVVYRVYMIGFMPGFAYMGKVNELLATPRKDQPRLQVAAGSVGIAGSQTGIYPVGSPGGWQIIGRTPLLLFDTGKLPPCLLAAGDNVQFVPIDKNEFRDYYGH